MSDMQTNPFESTTALRWRMVGPWRGGRVMAVAGHPQERMTFYFGSTGGGVWRSDDGGFIWKPLTDDAFARASVGALAIAPSNPAILYAGMGECGMRMDQSHGDGLYRSRDGGRTWSHQGLTATQNIARVVVHPAQANLLYVAAMGHRFGPNPERGIYRSRDGGATWEHIFFANERTGAIDLALDAAHPHILYAALWDMEMAPWGRRDRGPGSAIIRSMDGGDSWETISNNPALPAGPLGRIGLAVAAGKVGRLWALIDAPRLENRDMGGLFRSDDFGATWTWLSDDRNFLVRPWYFMHLTADGQDPDTLYVVNRKFWKSVDGGRSFRQVNCPYVDNHALWVDPADPQRMILGNDGGASVSFNGGDSWSTLLNQPTAEIYRVAADNHFPYRVYGSQQDNSTLALPSRSERGPISRMEWYDVGGGESGFITVRPDDPNIVYSSDLPGLGVTRYDHGNFQIREISPWMEGDGIATDAGGGEQIAYRFNWSTPIVLSPHDPNELYILGNRVFRTYDEGRTWQAISPDLTRNDPALLAGGSATGESPVVNDYCTICAFAESPLQRGLFWAGTDDGIVQRSLDGGATWQEVTPPGLPMWSTVNVEASPHAAQGVYICATAHARDDFRPYIFKSDDGGATWQAIAQGIPADEFVRVVRADPAQPGLLYAGTEAGVYVSLDDGARWQPLQNNLPHTPVFDLIVAHCDLVIGTHGRGLYVLDDLSAVRQFAAANKAQVALFAPRPVIRVTRQCYGLNSLNAAYEPWASPNPPAGIIVEYWLPEGFAATMQPLQLELLDADGVLISTWQSAGPALPHAPLGPLAYVLSGGVSLLKAKPHDQEEWGVKWNALTLPPPAPTTLSTQPGLNRFELPIMYPGPRAYPGIGAWAVPPLLVPGTYTVRLTAGNSVQSVTATVLPDPRVYTTQADFEAQRDLLLRIRDKVSETHDAIYALRAARARLQSDPSPKARERVAALTEIEEELIQTQRDEESGELDGIHFPPRLNARMAALAYPVARSDDAPSQPLLDLFADLSRRIDLRLARLHTLLDDQIVAP
jgi:photosystem II stability/assembly factor-like uncharacterized protein